MSDQGWIWSCDHCGYEIGQGVKADPDTNGLRSRCPRCGANSWTHYFEPVVFPSNVRLICESDSGRELQ